MNATFKVNVTKDDVASLLALLKGRGWTRGRQLRQELNVTRRHLSAIAEASQGKVIAGNKGYCLTAEASKPDLDSAVSKQRAQAYRTEQRMALTEQVWNSEHAPAF